MRYKILSFLKKNKFLYYINSIIKANINTKKTNKLYSDYGKINSNIKDKYSPKKIDYLLKRRLLDRGIDTTNNSYGNLNIFWVGVDYQQDSSGFLKGLGLAGKVTYFKDHKGDYGLFSKDKSNYDPFDIELVKKNSQCLLDQIKELHADEKVDLLIGQMWANDLDVQCLQEIQSMGIPTVNISMDDKLPNLWESANGRRLGSVGLAKGLDLVLTTSPDTCKWYWAEKCLAVYWPLASDPELFSPQKNKEYDVLFVGGNYGVRGQLVNQIKAADINISAFGPGWPSGYINSNKVADAFGKAKIILGSGFVAYNEDILTIKLRDFDAPMAGALYLTNRNPDLLEIFEEGKEIECYSSVEECIEKIKYYLNNQDALSMIASKGHMKAKTKYSWEHHIKNTINLVGFN